MDVYIIWTQLPCRYPGEYAPDIFDAWTEYQRDDNNEGWLEVVKKARDATARGDYEDCAVTRVTIPERDIHALFEPKHIVVRGQEPAE